MRKTKEALAWIVAILRKNRIPFQITGGFAANVYGVKRPLADIDIDVPTKALEKLYPQIHKYAYYGPKRYKDKHWDTQVMMTRYKGQEVDLCGADTARIYDKGSGRWIKCGFNLKSAKRKNVLGVTVNVVSKRELMRYKSKLRRRVDIADIKELKQSSKK